MTEKLNTLSARCFSHSFSRLSPLSFSFLPWCHTHSHIGIMWCRTWICSFCCNKCTAYNWFQMLKFSHGLRFPIQFTTIVLIIPSKTSSRVVSYSWFFSPQTLSFVWDWMRCINYVYVKQNTICFVLRIACSSLVGLLCLCHFAALHLPFLFEWLRIN